MIILKEIVHYSENNAIVYFVSAGKNKNKNKYALNRYYITPR